MIRHGVSVALALLTAALLFLLLVVEAKLAAVGARKPAAAVSGLSAMAAIALVMFVTLAAGRLFRRLAEVGLSRRRVTGGAPAPEDRATRSPEPSLHGKGMGRRP
ncbi:MAG: hypothetical protein HY002_21795 [Candidatus Rokubacteria bacterium]|nr:hypothetical protein [Candidatus Rokubacteria bacterium]